MAGVLNETEILMGYRKSCCLRGIALLFGDDNPPPSPRSSLWHAIESFLRIDTGVSLLPRLPLLSRSLDDFDLYTRERISFQDKYTLVIAPRVRVTSACAYWRVCEPNPSSRLLFDELVAIDDRDARCRSRSFLFPSNEINVGDAPSDSLVSSFNDLT